MLSLKIFLVFIFLSKLRFELLDISHAIRPSLTCWLAHQEELEMVPVPGQSSVWVSRDEPLGMSLPSTRDFFSKFSISSDISEIGENDARRASLGSKFSRDCSLPGSG